MTSVFRLIILLVVALIAIGVYFITSEDGYVLKISEKTIQAGLSKNTPMVRTYKDVFDVVIDEPRLDLVEGSDRVRAGVDIELSMRVLGKPITLNGSADAESAVAYQAQSGEVYLVNPVIAALEVPGLMPSIGGRVQDVVQLAVATYYRERPIYVLSDEKASEAAAKFVVRDVVIRNEQLRITLGARE